VNRMLQRLPCTRLRGRSKFDQSIPLSQEDYTTNRLREVALDMAAIVKSTGSQDHTPPQRNPAELRDKLVAALEEAGLPEMAPESARASTPAASRVLTRAGSTARRRVKLA
jgi:hypothetical protein